MKRDIIEETNRSNCKAENTLKGLLTKVSKSLMLRVHADEDNSNAEPESEPNKDGEDSKSTPTINYEDLISKARAEEKRKQYKTIETLTNQVNALTTQHNEDLLKVGQLEKDLETANTKLKSSGNDDSEVENLKRKVEELEKSKKSLEDNTVSREELETEIRAELEAEYTTKTYKATKMAELKDKILVPELVIGNTQEEIDASIEVALAKSEEIRKKLGVNEEEKPKSPQGRTPNTPSNPSVGHVQDSQFSSEYIAGLDVRSPEYAEIRKQLGLH